MEIISKNSLKKNLDQVYENMKQHKDLKSPMVKEPKKTFSKIPPMIEHISFCLKVKFFKNISRRFLTKIGDFFFYLKKFSFFFNYIKLIIKIKKLSFIVF